MICQMICQSLSPRDYYHTSTFHDKYRPLVDLHCNIKKITIVRTESQPILVISGVRTDQTRPKSGLVSLYSNHRILGLNKDQIQPTKPVSITTFARSSIYRSGQNRSSPRFETYRFSSHKSTAIFIRFLHASLVEFFL